MKFRSGACKTRSRSQEPVFRIRRRRRAACGLTLLCLARTDNLASAAPQMDAKLPLYGQRA